LYYFFSEEDGSESVSGKEREGGRERGLRVKV
jgi:hypothetical protein